MAHTGEIGAESAGGHQPVLHCAGLSSVGLVRARNEDVLWVDAERGWLVLADGMGGYRGGDVAATLAVSHVLDRLQHDAEANMDADVEAALLRSAVAEANMAIRTAAGLHHELAGMGATVVVALFRRHQLVHAHVGDSRVYRFRAGRLEQLTLDHTVLQEQIDAGMMDPETGRKLPYRGLLTRGLGVADDVLPDVGVHAVADGDRILLCSDGLTDMLEDGEIEALMGATGTPEALAESLIEAANDRGGRDNVSVIVAWFAG